MDPVLTALLPCLWKLLFVKKTMVIRCEFEPQEKIEDFSVGTPFSVSCPHSSAGLGSFHRYFSLLPHQHFKRGLGRGLNNLESEGNISSHQLS